MEDLSFTQKIQERQIKEEVLSLPDYDEDGIRLNAQTVGNLKRYLSQFPDNARVVINATDREGNYIEWDCQIACNFEHQHETNTVKFILGMVADIFND